MQSAATGSFVGIPVTSVVREQWASGKWPNYQFKWIVEHAKLKPENTYISVFYVKDQQRHLDALRQCKEIKILFESKLAVNTGYRDYYSLEEEVLAKSRNWNTDKGRERNMVVVYELASSQVPDAEEK